MILFFDYLCCILRDNDKYIYKNKLILINIPKINKQYHS